MNKSSESRVRRLDKPQIGVRQLRFSTEVKAIEELSNCICAVVFAKSRSFRRLNCKYAVKSEVVFIIYVMVRKCAAHLQFSVTNDGKRMLSPALLQLEALPFTQNVPYINRSSIPWSVWTILEPLLLTEGECDRNSVVQRICQLE
ncbi:hypothetical protein [Paenibacillus apiarius]|uniref:hypothetical protein n=1 Tax=Paenibacillus apiarius TaxID=46240 RepID=UPI00198058DC|nr:hypothetical protein [Paenibacillus apiarius]MBN3522397.1 hypothetical protein [Paenibacillus apiarius]